MGSQNNPCQILVVMETPLLLKLNGNMHGNDEDYICVLQSAMGKIIFFPKYKKSFVNVFSSNFFNYEF